MHGNIINSVDSLTDLSVMRSSDGKYTEDCHAIVRKAAKMGARGHIVRCKSLKGLI